MRLTWPFSSNCELNRLCLRNFYHNILTLNWLLCGELKRGCVTGFFNTGLRVCQKVEGVSTFFMKNLKTVLVYFLAIWLVFYNWNRKIRTFSTFLGISSKNANFWPVFIIYKLWWWSGDWDWQVSYFSWSFVCHSNDHFRITLDGFSVGCARVIRGICSQRLRQHLQQEEEVSSTFVAVVPRSRCTQTTRHLRCGRWLQQACVT